VGSQGWAGARRGRGTERTSVRVLLGVLVAVGAAACLPGQATAAWTAPVLVSPPDSLTPQVYISSGGESSVVWSRAYRTRPRGGRLGGKRALRAAASAQGLAVILPSLESNEALLLGRRSGALVRIAPAPGAFVGAAVGTDGRTTLVWRTSSIAPQIRARELGSQDVKVLDVNLSEGSENGLPVAAAAPNGDVLAVWQNAMGGPQTNLRGAWIRRDGTVGPVLELTEPASGTSWPRVTVGPDGTATVAYMRARYTSDFELARVTVEARRVARSGTISPVITVGERCCPDEPYFEMAAFGNGDAAVAWGGKDTIHERVLRGDGTLTASRILGDGNTSTSGFAVTAAGRRALIAWNRLVMRGGRPVASEIRVRALQPSGQLGPVRTLQRAPGAGHVRAAINGHGNAIVAWERVDTGGTSIFAAFDD
jgi:hypothetical protein